MRSGSPDVQLLCTLGPSSLTEQIILQLEDAGVSLFRINLSHTSLDVLEETLEFVQNISTVPLCIDTEGAQVRTGSVEGGEVSVSRHSLLRIARANPSDDRDQFSLYPASVFEQLSVGDILNVDFDHAIVQIVAHNDDHLLARVLNSGVVGQNRAVVVDRAIPLPPLTEKDLAAIDLAAALGVRTFALSFAESADAVSSLRSVTPPDSTLIAKIESLQGIQELNNIAAISDALLIDRGDLSSQVRIEYIPRIQKYIIENARLANTPVYVATNLLESMVARESPTRAEVNDIYNNLIDGADGLVLAGETAIGRFPVKCARMVVRVVDTLPDGARLSESVAAVTPLPDDPESFSKMPSERLPEPAEPAQFDGLQRICLSHRQLLDCEQLSSGAFSPLTGFLDQEALRSVLDHSRLPDGSAWPLPVILQIPASVGRKVSRGRQVALTDSSGTVHSLLEVTETYPIDLRTVAGIWFGTDSPEHPGVAAFMEGGDVALAGHVTQVGSFPRQPPHFEMTPSQSRALFRDLGWSTVLGFHSRNPMHRGHEAAQTLAFRRSGVDGIFLNPVIGPKKAGDFSDRVIVNSYRALLESGRYGISEVVFGCFATSSRYSGPRDAVFTALCRKNFGCTHFVIGRDHTGVGSFYTDDAIRSAFDDLGDIGIEPVFVEELGFDTSTSEYRPSLAGSSVEAISGTFIRKSLLEGSLVPEWMMHEVVQQSILHELKSGRAIVQS